MHPIRLTKGETEQKKKYYTVSVSCNNCHEYTTLTIPWGVPVEEHLSRPKNNICSNCECFIRRDLVSS